MENVERRRDRRRRLRLAFFRFSITSRERKSTRFRRRLPFFSRIFGTRKRRKEGKERKKKNWEKIGKRDEMGKKAAKRRGVFAPLLIFNDKTRDKGAGARRGRGPACSSLVANRRRKTNGVRDVKRAPYFLRSRRGLRRKLRPFRRVPFLRDGPFALFRVLRAVRRRNRREFVRFSERFRRNGN